MTAPQGQDIAVSVSGLTRTFGTFRAVDGIDLAVARGEVFGFLGPNGAGKSTTIRMLCGLLLPSAGSGTVGGFDIMKRSEEIKKNIGYMSQRFSLYDDLTVEENIDFFSGIYGVADEKKVGRKQWVLEMAGIADKRKAITRTMASGFKQRLALGCAVIHEPPVIFLDEPTSGVDPISRRRFWDLIYEMSSRGTTVFVTTHYLDEAENDLYQDWLDSLRDRVAKLAIIKRVARMEVGLFGDCKPLRDGVWELKVDVGAGYRVYYAHVGNMVIMLTSGGDKKSQSRDIERAVKLLKDWEKRNG